MPFKFGPPGRVCLCAAQILTITPLVAPLRVTDSDSEAATPGQLWVSSSGSGCGGPGPCSVTPSHPADFCPGPLPGPAPGRSPGPRPHLLQLASDSQASLTRLAMGLSPGLRAPVTAVTSLAFSLAPLLGKTQMAFVFDTPMSGKDSFIILHTRNAHVRHLVISSLTLSFCTRATALCLPSCHMIK